MMKKCCGKWYFLRSSYMNHLGKEAKKEEEQERLTEALDAHYLKHGIVVSRGFGGNYHTWKLGSFNP